MVDVDSEVVGAQTIEGDDCPELRTVDSNSWVIAAARGRGVGIAMRTAILAGRPVMVQQLRLTVDDWRSSGRGSTVTVDGIEPCRSWFVPAHDAHG